MCFVSQLFSPDLALFGFEAAGADHDEVNEPADAAKTARAEPDEARADLACEEAVNAELAEKECYENTPKSVHI